MRSRKRDDYVRFRPYQSFAIESPGKKRNASRVLQRVLWVVGVIAVILLAAIMIAANWVQG
jgi:hypothetical protein